MASFVRSQHDQLREHENRCLCKQSSVGLCENSRMTSKFISGELGFTSVLDIADVRK